MKHFAVLGNPVSHSRSPELFNSAFAHINFDGYYSRIVAENAGEAMEIFRSQNLTGMNVTAPFKREIIRFCNKLSPEATTIGAANLLLGERNETEGVNTDCDGVAEVLKKHGITSGTALIFGAGNAARAVVCALQQMNFKVIVAARSERDNAKRMQHDFNVQVIDIKNFATVLKGASLVVSTLPHGVFAGINPRNFAGVNATIFDANYNDSYFQKISDCNVLPFISGIEWLEAQALPCFRYFTGSSKYVYSSATDKKANLSLIGFSGSGKSAVGAELAKISGRKFVDLDTEICEKFAMMAAKIFNLLGEKKFRSAESELLKKIMSGRNIILACGGGVLTGGENISVLRQNSFRIRLYADFQTCLDRTASGEERPKMRDVGEAENLFVSRNPQYFENSDLNIATSGKTARVVAELLFKDLHNSGIL